MEKPQILTFGLGVVPTIRYLFSSYYLDQIAAPLGKYSLNIILEFYASYVAIVINGIPKRSKTLAQPLLTQTWYVMYLQTYQ